MKYKLRRLNLIPDALSQLVSKVIRSNKEEGTLEEIFIFNCILVKLEDNFKVRLKKAYNQDENWKKVLNLLFKEEPQELPPENETWEERDI